MRNPNRVLTRTQIGERVWDLNFEPTSNIIDVYISSLRKKIDRSGQRPLIHTIKNAGYSGIAVRDSEYGQDPTNNVTVTRNKVIGAANDGLDVTASTPGVVSADHNTLRSNGNDGIEMDAATSDNHLISNKASFNANFDCQDHSTGSHTAGTANIWLSNHGTTSDPPGLCTP